MLNNLRKSAAGGWAAKILIGLLVLAFATWGIADIFTPNPHAALATVGDEEITSRDLERARYEFQRQRPNVTEELMRLVSGSLLQQLVQEKLLDAHAKALGLGVPEKNLRDVIAGNANFRDVRGDFSAEVFRGHLRQLGLTETAYIERLRKEMLRNQLMNFFAGAEIKVPRSLILAQHQFNNNKRALEYITVTKANIEKIKPADDATLEDYYKKNISLYNAPEYRKVSYIYLNANDLKKDFKVEPAKLKEFYDKNRSRYVTSQERRHVKQIGFKDEKAAEEAYKELEKGKKFEDVAKQFGKNKSVNDLGLQRKAQLLDKKVAEAAFSLQKGKFSKPVKGVFQTVILLVEKIEPEVVTPFKKVEKEIEDRFTGRKARNKLGKMAKAIEDDRAQGLEMKKIAEKHKVEYREAWVDAKGLGLDGKAAKDVIEEGKDNAAKKPVAKNFPVSPKLLKEIFESDKGVDNEQVDIDRTQIAWFDVIGVEPSRTKSFKDVKEEVAKKWLEDTERKAIRTKATAILEELKKGAKLADVAKKQSLKVEKTKAVKRSETPKGVTSATVRQAFTLAKNQFGMSLGDKGASRILFQVTDIQQAPKLDDKRDKELQTRLSRSLMQDLAQQYISGLGPEFDLEYNDAAVRLAIGRSSSTL